MVKNYYKIGFLLFLCLLIYSRSPYIFNYGRFFSLDLNYHFEIEALNLINSLFFVDYSARYLNLISNISSIISSRFFDLENSQYVAVYLSLIIYLIIILKVLYEESRLFSNQIQRYIFSTLIILTPVMSFEIWLNAINLQVYLGLLTIIILFSNSVQSKKIINYFLLVLCGLSGIYSCALTPLFFLNFLRLKSKYNFICFFILFICSIIQLSLIIISSAINEIGYSNTALILDFSRYESISFIYNTVIRAFLGSSLPKFIFDIFGLNLNVILSNESLKDLLFFISLFISIILVFLIIWVFKTFKKQEERIVFTYLILIFLILSFVVIIGGVSDSLHGRYSALPGITIVLTVLYIASNSEKTFLKNLSIIFICCSLIFGFYDYRLKNYLVYLDCINCPDWKMEVKKYKNNKNYKPNAWPYHINR
tara:strand:- start:1403 stop:2671 length:1269 start_codon:yes stop_codon:yes gene_type:complete